MSSSLELVGKKIGPIGFGLMGFTWRESPPPQEQAFEAMRAAIANGCRLITTCLSLTMLI
jgi:pyridoxine 4-dehydrogenase